MSRLNSSDVKTKYEGLISLEGVLGLSIYLVCTVNVPYAALGRDKQLIGSSITRL